MDKFFLPRQLTFERKEDVLHNLSRSSSPGLDYFLLIILSCSIATMGLITDSAAVIIGAMLIAPLMSPILAISLASVSGQQEMFKRALIALVEGVILAVILSALISRAAYNSPFEVLKTIPSEILSRTRPSPFDLIIALAGGAAASYALAQPNLSEALPGVAISTALMPPLCTVGVGLALGNQSISLGAMLLFLTNFSAILFAAILVFLWLGFRPLYTATRFGGVRISVIVSFISVLIIGVALIFLSLRFVSEGQQATLIRSTVAEELQSIPDAELIDVTFNSSGETLQIEISAQTVRQPSYQQIVALQSAIANRLGEAVALQFVSVPITKLDPLNPPTSTPTPTLGPSATPTRTITPSPMPSATPTVTPTASDTPTATPTITPIIAAVFNTGGSGIYMSDEPNGKISSILPEGSLVTLTGEREQVNSLLWIEITDLIGRTGWLPSKYLNIRP